MFLLRFSGFSLADQMVLIMQVRLSFLGIDTSIGAENE